jgi:hypothetical protein
MVMVLFGIVGLKVIARWKPNGGNDEQFWERGGSGD